jgi:hypothetical protein
MPMGLAALDHQPPKIATTIGPRPIALGQSQAAPRHFSDPFSRFSAESARFRPSMWIADAMQSKTVTSEMQHRNRPYRFDGGSRTEDLLC